MFHCWMLDRRSTVKRRSRLLACVYFLVGAAAICHAPWLAFADGDVNEQMTKALEQPAPAPPRSPATIFVARKVITMEPGNPSGDAVAISGKRIIAAGGLAEVKKALGDRPFIVDETFRSKIVMPGFIDQHLHPVLGALTLAVEVIAPEDWNLPGKTFKAANNRDEYLSRLEAAEARLKNPNEWLLTWGYQSLWHGKLDREALDAISATRPIMIWQRSCHEFYFNTAGLKALGVTEEMTKGKGLASEQSNWREGHFWETGMNLIIAPVMKVLATPERVAFGLKQMVAYEHANGVTAYNEPGALYTPDMWKLYEQILGAPDTPMYSTFLADGRGIPDRVGLDKALDATEEQIAVAPEGAGKKLMFFPKQIKLFADGAIISQLMQMKDGYLDGHKGEWLMPPAELEERAKLYWDAGYQLHIHVNGDLGLETVLDVLERRMRENPRADHRTVIVHFANSTEEQIARAARLGAIVSANPYYTTGFADKYGQFGLGPKRADMMVRAASVLERKIPLSYHSDLPMEPSDPLYLAWAGVNRVTPSGRVAGPTQRISVDAALRAITINAAYSWRKENEIGSIAPGKIANFTVLDENPYEVAPIKLKDVPVWGTVFEGRVFPVPGGSKRADRSALPAPARSANASNDDTAPPSLETRTMRRFAVAPRDQSCDMVGLAHAAARAYEENLALAK
jgi:predicted amidohydrolase YtcJ